ncbi:MAG: FGGY-family carbohydrate kinase [Actinobacteria bacterium]|nr:FGGY-family carbohydrate kinase [Actinomycetota bacterium]
MVKEYFLGIDIGTYNSKGVLVNESGKICAQSKCSHRLIIPKSGYAEHDPNIWWNDFVFLARDILSNSGISNKYISAIGCSAIAPAVLPLDNYGNPLRNAILYGIDTRSVREVEELNNSIDEEKLLKFCGSLLSTQSAGPKILWFKRNEPSLFERAKKIVTATTYLTFKLTGKAVIDYYTAAAFSPLFDLKRRTWTNELYSEIDIDLLPNLAWSHEVIGEVNEEASRQTGLKKGTKVIAGTADAAAEALSAGIIEKGDLMIMYGSSGFFIKIVDEIITTKNLWSSVYIVPNKYTILAGMSTIGSLMEWYRNLINESSYVDLDLMAEKIPVGSEGIIILPYFSGERTPINNPKARGVIIGLSLSHNKNNIFRAILESIAYGIKDNVEAINRNYPYTNKIVAVGGGSNCYILLQIVSDVIGLPQFVPKINIGASYGDAFLAALGIGNFKSIENIMHWIQYSKEIQPIPENSNKYNEYFRIYKDLYKKTCEITNELINISNL